MSYTLSVLISCLRFVNNDPETVKVGQDSHSVSDQTQGNWNGIVGRMELRSQSRIEACRVYADIDSKIARVHLNLRALSAKEKATVTLRAEAFNTSASHSVVAKPVDMRLLTLESLRQTSRLIWVMACFFGTSLTLSFIVSMLM